MISVLQIRGARALLGWKQSQLADASGISVPAIARLEQNIGNPRADTLEALQQAFEAQGIEFFGENGVDLHRDIFRVETLEGLSGMQRVWDDMADSCANQKSEILMCGIDELLWIKLCGNRVGEEMKRRFEIKAKSRLLIREGDNVCLGAEDTYRCIPEAIFGQTPYFVYANRYAIVNWDPLRIILMHSKAIADTFRKQFEFSWAMGTPIKNPRILFPLFDKP